LDLPNIAKSGISVGIISLKGQKLYLITGVAGFIGSHVAHKLLAMGEKVIGVDNINDYYDTKLKEHRLESLLANSNFQLHKIDIADYVSLSKIPNINEVSTIIHLAAQAGVRYSIVNPFAYAHSNLLGHLSILELARHNPNRPLLIYASSSSIYGNSSTAPFSEDAIVKAPVSLYAATKISGEVLSQSYANLYGISQIGLRFFTVYGPKGRPDMAYWGFCNDILNDKPIKVFNNGKLRRDFTYIDDVVEGIVRIATQSANFENPDAPHKIYNIGNNKPVELIEFIQTIENALGKKAILEMLPMQKGDVYETCANVDKLAADYGFTPHTSLKDGIDEFVKWFKPWRENK
jgi:UDP-glucuronate 4-epimerase